MATSSTGMKITASGRSFRTCSTIAFCSSTLSGFFGTKMHDARARRPRDLVGGDAERLIGRVGRVFCEDRDGHSVGCLRVTREQSHRTGQHGRNQDIASQPPWRLTRNSIPSLRGAKRRSNPALPIPVSWIASLSLLAMTNYLTATESSFDTPGRSAAAPPVPGEIPHRAPARRRGRPAPAPDRGYVRRSRSRCAGASRSNTLNSSRITVGASPSNGSSSSSSLTLPDIARATATICCSPPDR